MTEQDWAQLFFVALPAIDLAATVIFWRWVRAAGGWGASPTFLRMGAITTTVIWFSTSIIAVLSLVGLLHQPMDASTRLRLGVLALALPSFTSVLWVTLYALRRRRGGV